MHPAQTSSALPGGERHLVDLQYEEVDSTRTVTLNREALRLQAEGWEVETVGDHLVASCCEPGHSQLERLLIGTGGFLALAYLATIFLTDLVAELPVSELVFVGGATLLGGLVALLTRGQAAGERRVTVSIDGHGRPFTVE